MDACGMKRFAALVFSTALNGNAFQQSRSTPARRGFERAAMAPAAALSQKQKVWVDLNRNKLSGSGFLNEVAIENGASDEQR
jgi:hypothetical protein